MKKNILGKPALIFLLVLFEVLPVSAQDSSTFSTIYFMRKFSSVRQVLRQGALNYSLNSYAVFIDSNFICNLHEKRYFSRQVPAGTHKISVQYRDKKLRSDADRIFLKTEAGKSYYIAIENESSDFSRSVLFLKMSENTGSALLSTLKIDERCGDDN